MKLLLKLDVELSLCIHGILVQGPVPETKICRCSRFRVSPWSPRLLIHGFNQFQANVVLYVYIEKKIEYNWTHGVQIAVVQGLTVFTLSRNEIKLIRSTILQHLKLLKILKFS